MKNKELIRLGDTSFRLKNQVNFYINLMNEIYEMHENKKEIDLEKIYNNLNDKNIINYKKNKSKINREKLMIKQLKLFKLLENDYNDKILCSKLFIKYMNISSEKLKKFHASTLISFEEIFFSLLILLNDEKNSANMKMFIKFIENKEIINDNIIALFSFCDSLTEFNKYSCYERKDVLKEIFHFCDKNDFDQIINLYNKKKNDINNIDKLLFTKINEIMKVKNNPSFKKPLKNFRNIIDFLDKCDSKNLKLSLKRNREIEKLIKKLIKMFNISKNIMYTVNSNENDRLLIFNYFILMKKYELIYKDYLDINRRWFVNINILNSIGCDKKSKIQKYSINKSVLLLLLEIEKKFSFLNENNLDEIFDFALEYLGNNESNIDYPFDKEEVANILEAYYNGDDEFIYNLLDQKEIYNVSKFVAFEYFVNLSFSLSYNYKPKDFIEKYCGTKLDSNLLPISHCPGRKSDGIIIDSKNDNTIFSTIESTILSNIYLHREKESIQRHSYDYFNSNKKWINNDLPTCIFVSNDELSNNNIKLFCSFAQSNYINDLDIKIRIIFLNSFLISKLLKENKLEKLLRNILNIIPFDENDNIIELNKWYLNIFDSII